MISTHTERVQLLIAPELRRDFEIQARLEGLSLSAWLRAAGKERVERSRARRKLQTKEELESFFAERDESGSEPDWTEHLTVIDESRSQGRPSS